MKREKLWNRDFILAMAGGFFPASIVFALMTTLAIYSMDRYGVSEGWAGFSASILMIGGVAGRLYAGKCMDRVGRRKMIIVSGILNVVMCVLYFVPWAFVPFLALRFLHGFISGVTNNAMATAVIDFIPQSRRGEGMGIYSLAYTFATVVGPWLGMTITDRFPYEALWGVNIVFSSVSLVVLAAIRFRPSGLADGQRQLKTKGGFDELFEKSALPLAVMIFLLSICYASITAFLESYAEQLDLSWIASMFFVIYGLFLLVTRPVAGCLLDRFRENFIVVPTLLFFVVSLTALGLAGILSRNIALELILAGAFFLAIGFGTLLPMGQVIAVKYVESHHFARTTSTYWLFSDSGMGFGALLLGFLASGVGLSYMFLFEIVLVVSAFLVYWLFHGRHK